VATQSKAAKYAFVSSLPTTGVPSCPSRTAIESQKSGLLVAIEIVWPAVAGMGWLDAPRHQPERHRAADRERRRRDERLRHLRDADVDLLGRRIGLAERRVRRREDRVDARRVETGAWPR
jgi:hypothetical protein